MSLLKFTAKKFVTMFAVLIAVVLITAVVVTLNIEMSLENRIHQEVMDDIAQNPALCNDFSSMDECIKYYVELRMNSLTG